ncbi:MAG: hypothetical protein KDA89_02435 [Planctomycetaceae bacterium]|nr:hypothetical protein [Planctomycetaceae bacterium]
MNAAHNDFDEDQLAGNRIRRSRDSSIHNLPVSREVSRPLRALRNAVEVFKRKNIGFDPSAPVGQAPA